MSNKPRGWELILRERNKQIARGYTPEHDMQHDGQEFLIVAVGLLLSALKLPEATEFCQEYGHDQPWMKYIWDHERPDEIKGLVIAGAMIAAEIDRLGEG